MTPGPYTPGTLRRANTRPVMRDARDPEHTGQPEYLLPHARAHACTHTHAIQHPLAEYNETQNEARPLTSFFSLE